MQAVEAQPLKIYLHRSADSRAGELIISAAWISESGSKARTVDLVVGRVGFPSVQRTLGVGGAIYFDTTFDGVYEVRVLAFEEPPVRGTELFSPPCAVVRISQLRPASGQLQGFALPDIDNVPFAPKEVARIQSSLRSVQDQVSQRKDVTSEQQEFVNRKLDEIAEASTRLGRKDWINLAVGTLTNVLVNAGLSSATARAIFQAAAEALTWVVGPALRLLS